MNLEKSRILFAVSIAGFLVLCNLGYLFAYSQGRQSAFSGQISQPPVQILSLLFLVGIIGFAVVKTRSNGDES
jgi:succinate dehydrogenase hydrophobic anchor subunit